MKKFNTALGILILNLIIFSNLNVYSGDFQSLNTTTVLAKINGEDIAVKDIIKFAKRNPSLYPYLQIDNGYKKILCELVFRRVLILEGKERGIVHKKGVPEGLYALKVRNRLLPKIQPLKEDQLKDFYKNHKELFSTPKMYKLRIIKILKSKNPEISRKKIQKAYNALQNRTFEQVAIEYGNDKLIQMLKGDIGYIPENAITNPVIQKQLEHMKPNEISPILETKEAFVILKLEDIRPPISDPFEEVKPKIKEVAKNYLKQKEIAKLRKKLEKKWNVKYLVNCKERVL